MPYKFCYIWFLGNVTMLYSHKVGSKWLPFFSLGSVKIKVQDGVHCKWHSDSITLNWILYVEHPNRKSFRSFIQTDRKAFQTSFFFKYFFIGKLIFNKKYFCLLYIKVTLTLSTQINSLFLELFSISITSIL